MPFFTWGLENIRLIQSDRCAVGWMCLVRVLSAGFAAKRHSDLKSCKSSDLRVHVQEFC